MTNFLNASGDASNPPNGGYDPSKDSHLFDVKKVVHSKDDVSKLNQLLKRIPSSLLPKFSHIEKPKNPIGITCRAMFHNGRTRKGNKAYSPKHNDRNFESTPDHIDKKKTPENVLWNCYGPEYTFEEAEHKFYERYMPQWQRICDNNNRSGHGKRNKDFLNWVYNSGKHYCPMESLFGIGKVTNHPDHKILQSCFEQLFSEMVEWSKMHGDHWHPLSYALHLDEQGAPHYQLRSTFDYVDDKGILCVGQEKALAKMGFELPDPSKKMIQTNNRKMLWDAMWRKRWIEICMEHGIDIILEPLPPEKVGKDLKQYIIQQEEERKNAVAAADEKSKAAEETLQQAQNLNEQNMENLKIIDEWNEASKIIYNESIEERIDDLLYIFQHNTYRPEAFDECKKSISEILKGAVAETKHKYDNRFEETNKQIFGYQRFYKIGNNHYVEYDFGLADYSKMFTETSAEDFAKAFDYCKSKGKNTIGEMLSDETEGLDFLEKFFPHAIEMKKTINRKLERNRNKDQGVSY